MRMYSHSKGMKRMVGRAIGYAIRTNPKYRQHHSSSGNVSASQLTSIAVPFAIIAGIGLIVFLLGSAGH